MKSNGWRFGTLVLYHAPQAASNFPHFFPHLIVTICHILYLWLEIIFCRLQ
nr:MAG TPA: hypothetical protein [Caudoviricetes sp.]